MRNTFLTIGLFDKDSKKQEIATCDAKSIISETLINDGKLYAFTMIECSGVYRHENGEIVSEPSIRVEIADDELQLVDLYRIVGILKIKLNQECVMITQQEIYTDFF